MRIGNFGLSSPICTIASLLIPQEFVLSTGKVRCIHSEMNPLIHKMFVTNIQSSGLDPRIVLAATMLLIAIEGRQGWLITSI